MIYRNDITAERARQLLRYDSQKGVLIWRRRATNQSFNSRFSGKVAGCREERGYSKIRVDGVLYYVHRLIWLIVRGEWPAENMDHETGVKNGDGLKNIRPATQSQNMQNASTPKHNTSGHRGVSWSKVSSKWHAYISVKGRRINLGFFSEKSDAVDAYLTAKRKYHPFQPVPRETI